MDDLSAVSEEQLLLELYNRGRIKFIEVHKLVDPRVYPKNTPLEDFLGQQLSAIAGRELVEIYPLKHTERDDGILHYTLRIPYVRPANAKS